jgi:hypothetical protein
VIEIKNGRFRSSRTIEELENALHNEIKSLTDSEREVLDLLFAEVRDGGDPSLLHWLESAEYKRPVVPMEQFLTDPYYLGVTCSTVYPKLKADLVELFEGGYSEAVLTGCVSHDSIVYGGNGSLNLLGELIGTQPKTGVVVIDDDRGSKTSACGPIVDSGVRPVINIVLRNGFEVKVTPDHKVRVYRDWRYQWVPARNLKLGDHVVVARFVETAPDRNPGVKRARYLGGLDCELGVDARVPDEILRSPNATLIEYLKRLFAIHAKFSDALNVSITSKSSFFIRQLHLVLLRFGIRSRIQLRYESRLEINEVLSLRLFCELFDISVFFPEACKRLNRFFSLEEAANTSYDASDAGAQRLSNFDRDLALEPVVRVEDLGESVPTGDVTNVEVGRRFLCNGVVVSNSIGYGKTYFASIGICRVLYELSCMVNPQRSFGIAEGSGVVVTVMSVTEALAQKVSFENVATKIKASPYFQEHFPFTSSKKELKFPNAVFVAARAATDTSALGLNSIAGMMDESNFLSSVVSSNKSQPLSLADTIYTTIKRRMKSRFGRMGRLPGILFLVSSKKTKDDFTARRVEQSLSDPTVFVRDYSLWDVKPDEYHSSKRFWVFVGNENTLSRILEPGEEVALKEHPIEGSVLIEVPEDYRQDFESDLEGSIRDLAGISTTSVNPYIQQRQKIRDAVVAGRRHPFSTEVLDLSRRGFFLRDQMVAKFVDRISPGVTEERIAPLLNPGIPRRVHIDPSLRGDATGLCMAHVHGYKDVVRRNRQQEKFIERAPIYVVDLFLRIEPPMGGEILLSDVRALVYELTKMGYPIVGVSLDSYQSADSIQQLKAQGYTSEVISVDTSPDPYDNLKQALYDDRVQMYDYPVVITELRELEEDRRGKLRKIDHPPKKSKDVADALAGVCWALKKGINSEPLPMISNLEPSGKTPLGFAQVVEESAVKEKYDLLPFFGGGVG